MNRMTESEKRKKCAHLAFILWQELEAPDSDLMDSVFTALVMHDVEWLQDILKANGIEEYE